MVSAEKYFALKLSTIDRQNISLTSTYYDNFYPDIKTPFHNHVFVFAAKINLKLSPVINLEKTDGTGTH